VKKKDLIRLGKPITDNHNHDSFAMTLLALEFSFAATNGEAAQRPKTKSRIIVHGKFQTAIRERPGKSPPVLASFSDYDEWKRRGQR